MTDAQRAGLGIPVRAETRTPAGAPISRPLATVDTSRRLAHVISFKDEQTPKSKAKPAGTMGAEVGEDRRHPAGGPGRTDVPGAGHPHPLLGGVRRRPGQQESPLHAARVSTRGAKGPWS